MPNIPEQLVAQFFNNYSEAHDFQALDQSFNATELNRDVINQLTRLALSTETDVAELATRAIFASLVERLADSFEPDAARLYNLVFSQIIQLCRSDSRAAALDRELTGFGLLSEEDLLGRAEGLNRAPRLVTSDLEHSLKRVIVLSRVTLGADVAITSVILERMKLLFPSAEIVLVGGKKTSELFGGDRRLQFKHIDYRRGGTLIERLLAWIDLLASVRELSSGLSDGEFLVIDPDSRLTQLGLLPVTKTGDRGQGTGFRVSGSELKSGELPNYLFFPSREYGSTTTKSLAQLASDWLDEIFGVSETTLPRVSLKREDIDVARQLAAQLRGDRSRRLVAINFGVGENPFKRVGAEFEVSLINHLAQDGVSIILDKGASVEETGLVDKIVADATSLGLDRRVRSIEVTEATLIEHLDATHLDADILVWNGRIGMLAALISESDLYIGYDSAGQHIAAALGVPCIDVFGGSSSPRMLDRWKPMGPAESQVVPFDARSANAMDVLERVLAVSYAWMTG
jgi:ADP-heptose:LPS heptosyltransferase